MQLRMKTNNCGELNLSNIDQEVTLSGWVDCVRDLGGMIFIELRDRTGFFQLVSDPQKNPEIHKVFEKIRNEYVITVKGKVTRRPEETYNEKYPTGQVEMYPDSLEILSTAKVLPFVLDDENVSAVADELYKKIESVGIEVLYDDRNVSAGVKLTDSELMGVPIRVVISPKTLANGQVEVTIRATGEKIFMPIGEFIPELKVMIQDEIDEIENS